ncbi:MAG: V-type ATP synthase subunit E family protein [Candidatus Nanohaloarchaea archaeon]
MGLQEVKSDILEDAESRADDIVKEAEEQAQEILDEAEEEAEEIREKYEKQLEDEKEAYRKKEISNANMKAREKELQAKQEKMEQVFQEFREELKDLSDDERENYIKNCMDSVDFEVGKVLGGSEFEAFVDTDFEEEDIDGIIVVSKDGNRRQNFTFSKIVDQFEDEYRKNVAEKLFED